MRTLIATLFGFGALVLMSLCHAEVYRWVDPEGVVHFADEPVPGAKPVRNKSITTIPAKAFTSSTDKTKRSAELQHYEYIKITAPTSQSTIWDANGRVAVVLECKPALRKQDGIVLLLDNQAIAKPTKNRLIALAGITRGAHTLSAKIVNGQHKTIQSSKTVVFYLQKPRLTKPDVSGEVLKNPQ